MISIELKCEFEIDMEDKEKLMKRIRREINKLGKNVYIDEHYVYGMNLESDDNESLGEDDE